MMRVNHGILIFIAVSLLSWCVFVLRNVLVTRRREAPLRRDAMAQPVTWSTTAVSVSAVTRTLGIRWGSGGGAVGLNLRGGYIEILGAFPGSKFMGLEWYLRSRDVKIEALRGVLQRRISLKGPSAGQRDIELILWSTGDLRDVWYALIADGAIPVGPPPDGPAGSAGRSLPGGDSQLS
jgi:hypothetical protein